MNRPLIVLVLILVLGGILISGCTMTETPRERNRRIMQISDFRMRMIVEDWDYIWLYHKNDNTTYWHPWVGM